jgi:hypothetical protein
MYTRHKQTIAREKTAAEAQIVPTITFRRSCPFLPTVPPLSSLPCTIIPIRLATFPVRSRRRFNLIAITFVAMHHLPNSLASLFPLMLHRIIAAISAYHYANRRHIRCSQAVVTSQAG